MMALKSALLSLASFVTEWLRSLGGVGGRVANEVSPGATSTMTMLRRPRSSNRPFSTSSPAMMMGVSARGKNASSIPRVLAVTMHRIHNLPGTVGFGRHVKTRAGISLHLNAFPASSGRYRTNRKCWAAAGEERGGVGSSGKPFLAAAPHFHLQVCDRSHHIISTTSLHFTSLPTPPCRRLNRDCSMIPQGWF